MVLPYAGPLLLGAVLAVVFDPVHQRIDRRIRRKTLAAALSTGILVIAFLAPVTLLALLLGHELRQAYDALQSAARNGGAGRLWQALERPLASVAPWFGMTEGALRELIVSRLGATTAAVVRGAMELIGSAPGGVVKALVTLAAFYYTLSDGDRLYRQTLAWCPLGPERTGELLRAVQQTIVASFYGVIAVAAAQGGLFGLGVWFAGISSPLLWGLGAAVVSVIPVIGSAIVWVPAAAVLFLHGSWERGLFMILWGAGLVANADNVVRPLVVTTQLPVNALVIFVSMLGGVTTFGVIGILVGPVTVAVTIVLFRFLREEFGAAG